jgi:hypothetical protein
VIQPLLATPGSSQELPETSHPLIALTRLKAAIAHSAAAPLIDLGLLQQTGGHGDLCAKVAGYERVRRRPGRDQALLTNVQKEALSSISAAISPMEQRGTV